MTENGLKLHCQAHAWLTKTVHWPKTITTTKMNLILKHCTRTKTIQQQQPHQDSFSQTIIGGVLIKKWCLCSVGALILWLTNNHFPCSKREWNHWLSSSHPCVRGTNNYQVISFRCRHWTIGETTREKRQSCLHHIWENRRNQWGDRPIGSVITSSISSVITCLMTSVNTLFVSSVITFFPRLLFYHVFCEFGNHVFHEFGNLMFSEITYPSRFLRVR